LTAGPFDAKNEALPIGQSGEVLIALDPAIPSGSWKVQVTLHSGLIENTAEAVLGALCVGLALTFRRRPRESLPPRARGKPVSAAAAVDDGREES